MILEERVKRSKIDLTILSRKIGWIRLFSVVSNKLQVLNPCNNNYMGDYFSKIGSVIQNEVSRGGGAVNINTHPLSMQDGFEFVP